MNEEHITCPDCHGTGKILVAFKMIDLVCDRCGGSGKCPAIMLEWMEKGRVLRQERLSRRVSLREESLEKGMDVMILSHAERGITNPDMLKHLTKP